MIYLFLPQIDTEHLFKFFILSVIKPIRFSSKLHFSLENLFRILLVSCQASSTEVNFSHHQIIHRNKHPLDSHLNSNDQASYNHNSPFTSLSGWSKKKNPFHEMPYKKMLFITWTIVIVFPRITSKEISFASFFSLWLDYSSRYRSTQPRDNSLSHQPVDSNEKNYSPSFSVRSRGSLSWHERD